MPEPKFLIARSDVGQLSVVGVTDYSKKGYVHPHISRQATSPADGLDSRGSLLDF